MPLAATACPSRSWSGYPSCGVSPDASDAWPDVPNDVFGASDCDCDSDNCSSSSRSNDGDSTSTCPSSIGIDNRPPLNASSVAGSGEWPHSPCSSRPESPTRPSGDCALDSEDIWIGLDLEFLDFG